MVFAVSFIGSLKSSIFASSFMNKDPPVSSLQKGLFLEPLYAPLLASFTRWLHFKEIITPVPHWKNSILWRKNTLNPMLRAPNVSSNISIPYYAIAYVMVNITWPILNTSQGEVFPRPEISRTKKPHICQGKNLGPKEGQIYPPPGPTTVPPLRFLAFE